MTRVPGIVEWLRPGEHARAERVLEDLRRLGVEELRTNVSWADWHTEEGQRWYAWLLPKLGEQVRLLPVCSFTPPSLGIEPRTSSPPRRLRDYADWLDQLVGRHGDTFTQVELWNEPNQLASWDHRLDPYGALFAEMIRCAAHWLRRRGKRTVLGGMRPVDPSWLSALASRGALDEIDAVGIHGYPDPFAVEWEPWGAMVRVVRDVLERHGLDAEVWITEAGFSTWRHDEGRQLRELVEVLRAPAERVYWATLHDLDPDVPSAAGFHVDERVYHCGIKRADGSSKLAARLWEEGGIERVRSHVRLARTRPWNGNGLPVAVVTGGAGFVGSNVAARLLERGNRVVLLDNLSRPSIERNVRWLEERFGDRVQLHLADIRNPYAIREVVRGADQVFHFAAQVAVTTSIKGPMVDLDVNGRGTLSLLEALRALPDPPPLLFTSTNKVYGALPDVGLRARGDRYEPESPELRAHGIGEDRPLDFHSPYGCSKGVADQYVLDYARTFDLPTLVFRMSCIYGTRQFGNEEQGWVAHFVSRALAGQPITVFGDGKQVRDILFVDDLVDAMMLAMERIDAIRGEAFNVGGGVDNTSSLLELLDRIEAMLGTRAPVRFQPWRPGDQRYYVSSFRKLQDATGWRPRHSVDAGLARLYEWLVELHGQGGAPRPSRPSFEGGLATRSGTEL